MFCYQVSKEEAEAMWGRMCKSHTTLMNTYVPWCIGLGRRGYDNNDYLLATMHHWDEFIAFLTRKKLKGEFE